MEKYGSVINKRSTQYCEPVSEQPQCVEKSQTKLDELDNEIQLLGKTISGVFDKLVRYIPEPQPFTPAPTEPCATQIEGHINRLRNDVNACRGQLNWLLENTARL